MALDGAVTDDAATTENTVMIITEPTPNRQRPQPRPLRHRHVAPAVTDPASPTLTVTAGPARCAPTARRQRRRTTSTRARSVTIDGHKARRQVDKDHRERPATQTRTR